MKRNKIYITLCVLFFAAIFYISISRKPTVCAFVTEADSTGYNASLSVVMNTLGILDTQKTKNALIEQIKENDFKNMQFPFEEMGYPRKIKVTVYSNNYAKRKGIPAIQFDYVFEL